MGEHRLARLRHGVRKGVATGDVIRGRCAYAELLGLVGQVDGRRVGVQHPAHLNDQLSEGAVQGAVRQRRIHQGLHAAHQLGHALGLGARGLLPQQGLALGLAAQPLGHVGDEARHEHLAANVHLGHRGLTRKATAVATHELDLEGLGRERGVARGQRKSALVVALAELGRHDQRAHRLADRLGRCPAKEPVGRRVPAHDDSVAVERDERVWCRVQHEPGAHLRALELLGALAQPAQERGDEQPGEQRSADRQEASARPGCRGSGSRARSRTRSRSRSCGRTPRSAGRSRRRREPPTCRAAGRASTGRRNSSRGSRSARRRRAPRGCANRGCGRRSTRPPRQPRSPPMRAVRGRGRSPRPSAGTPA